MKDPVEAVEEDAESRFSMVWMRYRKLGPDVGRPERARVDLTWFCS